jgi:hypothetical protein
VGGAWPIPDKEAARMILAALVAADAGERVAVAADPAERLAEEPGLVAARNGAA